jgi:hypothetical protein
MCGRDREADHGDQGQRPRYAGPLEDALGPHPPGSTEAGSWGGGRPFVHLDVAHCPALYQPRYDKNQPRRTCWSAFRQVTALREIYSPTLGRRYQHGVL